jgi:hypothetical protein
MQRRSFLKQTALGTAALSAYPEIMLPGEIPETHANQGNRSFNGDEKPLKIAVIQQYGNPGEVDITRQKAITDRLS